QKLHAAVPVEGRDHLLLAAAAGRGFDRHVGDALDAVEPGGVGEERRRLKPREGERTLKRRQTPRRVQGHAAPARSVVERELDEVERELTALQDGLGAGLAELDLPDRDPAGPEGE